jgi:hypothetical protein
MILTLTLEAAGVLHDYALRSLSGYHRPLNSEAVTVTVELDVEDRSDFMTPLLGAAATLTVDGETVLSGYLTRLVWTPAALIAEVEG